MVRCMISWMMLFFIPVHVVAADSASVSGNDLGTAELQAITGTVQVKCVNAVDWVTASPGMALQPGDRVKTGADASCDMVLGDGTLIEVGAETETAVTEDTPAGRGYAHAVYLWFGKVLAHVEKITEPKARFAVHTPVAVCAVRGTEFAVEATADDATVGVFDGTVDVSGVGAPAQDAARITANQETAVRRGGRPVPPRGISAGMAARRVRLVALRQRAQIVRARWQNLSPDQRRALRQKALERRQNLRAHLRDQHRKNTAMRQNRQQKKNAVRRSRFQ